MDEKKKYLYSVPAVAKPFEARAITSVSSIVMWTEN
jgi:hypothetical protein